MHFLKSCLNEVVFQKEVLEGGHGSVELIQSKWKGASGPFKLLTEKNGTVARVKPAKGSLSI